MKHGGHVTLAGLEIINNEIIKRNELPELEFPLLVV